MHRPISFWGESDVAMENVPPPPSHRSAAPGAQPGSTRQPAGFWIRVVAAIIDGLVVSVISSLVAGIIAIVVVASDEANQDVVTGIGVFVGILAVVCFNWLYEALMTSSPRGATYGKRAIGARVVRGDGTQLSFGRATARYLAKTVITPLLPLGIGYMLAGWTQGKRAIHDMIADTLVIRTN